MGHPIFDGIKTTFDAEETLDDLSPLYLGEVPDPETRERPFCTQVPVEDVETSGTFATKFYTERFQLIVVGDTFEELQAWDRAIEKVYDDYSGAIHVFDPYTIMSISKLSSSYEELEYAFALTIIYEVEYYKERER